MNPLAPRPMIWVPVGMRPGALCIDDELLQILQQFDPDGLRQPGPLGRLESEGEEG